MARSASTLLVAIPTELTPAALLLETRTFCVGLSCTGLAASDLSALPGLQGPTEDTALGAGVVDEHERSGIASDSSALALEGSLSAEDDILYMQMIARARLALNPGAGFEQDS